MRGLSSDQIDDEKVDHGWKFKSEWYPKEVREDRSEGLLKFIDHTLRDMKTELRLSDTKLWNNMSNGQRQALSLLANDSNIVIKQADKGGAIVILNANDYNAACLETLSDPSVYQEEQTDPNSIYRQQVDAQLKIMHEAKYINKHE